MRRKPLVCCGVVSLGLHMAVIAALLVPGAMVRSKTTVMEVGFVNVPPRPVFEKTVGSAAIAVAKQPSLKLKGPDWKARPDPAKTAEGKRSLNVKVPTVSPLSSAELPKNVRQKPPSSPSTAKPALEAKRAPAASEAPYRTPGEVSGASVKFPDQERQAYRPLPDDKSGRDAGLLSMTKTEESVADPAGSSIDTALFEATPISAENSPPTYPRAARRQGWEGEVWLRVRLADTGQVLEVRIERSSGYRILDRAALVAVRHWRFHPSHLGAKPLADDVRVPVRFELQEP